ncbi:MAG: ABC transporter substrate binding protein, partial [Mariprofundaceae bacterium]|nr:ABC transporter substrate binding protein [Mariprofundaceae bacterium]
MASQAAGIAVIGHANIKPYQLAIAGFREHIQLPLQIYYLNRTSEQNKATARAIHQQHPVLIFALGKSALRFARRMRCDVPIVFTFVLHPPHASNAVHSSEFGIAMSIPPAQQFNRLMTIVPTIQDMAVVYNPKKSKAMVEQAKVAAKHLGIHFIAIPASNQKDAAAGVAEVMPKVDAMWMIPDVTVLTSTTWKQMLHLSLKHSVALIGLAPKYVRSGCLFALSFDSYSIGAQAADMARRLLAGKKVPLQTSPNIAHFTLNQHTAKQLGLYLSPSLLKQVDYLYGET